MRFLGRIAVALHLAMIVACPPAGAQEPHAVENDLPLSPELVELLREEMRALLAGMQSLAAAIATADWGSVADTSAQISASYLLDRKLAPAQRTELETSLPEHFKRLDSGFHLEARKLEAAAARHDQQLATFHYYRLLESCTTCHELYATARFPGFKPSTEGTHHH